MAIDDLQPLASYVGGSVGDRVFARNQHGMYSRARSKPQNTPSNLKTRVKNHFTRLFVRWNDRLTPAERTAWNEYAACAVVFSSSHVRKRLTGLQHFFRSNMPRVFTGLVALHTAPTTYGSVDWTSPFNLDDSFTGLFFFNLNTADTWANTPGSAMLIQISPVQAKTINFFNGPWRRADWVLATAGGVPALNLANDPWVPFVPATRRWMRAYVMLADGRVSAPRIFPFTDNV